MQVLGTFQSRDAADGVRDSFLAEGFNAADLIVMVNREAATPPEDAQLEVGVEGEGGFRELEEKVGKAVLHMMGRPAVLDGDGSEGTGRGGALLAVTVADDAQAAKARALMERHWASDIELSQ